MSYKRNKTEELLSIREIGQILDVGYQTVATMMHNGAFGKFIMAGSRYRIPRSGVEKYIEERMGK